MPHTISDFSILPIILRFLFFDILWRYFCFKWKLFFFLSNSITCCCGVLILILHMGGTATSTFTGSESSVGRKFCFGFQIFFQNLLVCHFENFQRKYFLTLSRGICDCVVSVNTKEFYSCCDNISTFPALSGVFWNFFGWFICVDIFFLEIYFEFYSFFFF